MGKITINYNYEVGQVVYFMKDNEIRRGIVNDIEIRVNSSSLKTHLTTKIVRGLIKIFKKDYPFKEADIRYSLSLVSKDEGFGGSPYIHYEEDVYESKEAIIKSLT